MKKRRLDTSQVAKLPRGIPPDIPVARLDSRNRLTMPQEILDRKGFKAGDNIGFKIDEYNMVTLMHVDKPIMNLKGAGTGLFEGFDLEKEREFSWPD
jgi:bifunctional DNA-binding transcriptional regulator/antitoxin component of YhaV-PrlF toxin-antitoxin module